MTQPQWKIINDFENYEVSNEGQIRKEDTKKIIEDPPVLTAKCTG